MPKEYPNHPLDEVQHLRTIAEMDLSELPEGSTAVVALACAKGGRAVIWNHEADALERGYLLGRIMAAFDVRMGLDTIVGNGSVHYDSDVEAPPVWLMSMAEKLARGDA